MGAGFTVDFIGLHLDFQARDAFNTYWGKMQNDFLYSGSLSMGIF